MRLEGQELGRRDRFEAARHARAARELSGADGRVVRDAVVWVERVERGVGHDEPGA
jgi:hypothetical protein